MSGAWSIHQRTFTCVFFYAGTIVLQLPSSPLSWAMLGRGLNTSPFFCSSQPGAALQSLHIEFKQTRKNIFLPPLFSCVDCD
jgi:hypothetical protein